MGCALPFCRFLLIILGQIVLNLNIALMVPFQNRVRQPHRPSYMTVTKNQNVFKWPKKTPQRCYLKLESAAI